MRSTIKELVRATAVSQPGIDRSTPIALRDVPDEVRCEAAAQRAVASSQLAWLRRVVLKGTDVAYQTKQHEQRHQGHFEILERWTPHWCGARIR